MNLTPCPRCREAAFDLNRAMYGMCDTCQRAVSDDRHRAVTSVTRMVDGGLLSADQGQRLINRIGGRADSLTADRQPVLIGGTYIDYDLKPTIVTGIETISLDHREKDGAAIWWRTTTGMFDGTRLVVAVPR